MFKLGEFTSEDWQRLGKEQGTTLVIVGGQEVARSGYSPLFDYNRWQRTLESVSELARADRKKMFVAYLHEGGAVFL
jgi:hypothetical protein